MAAAAASPLAPVLADLVRDLRTARLIAACQRDFIHWLTETHVRARLRHYRPPLDPSTPEGRAALQRERCNVLAEWGEELDRQARDRATVRGKQVAA